ncbi:MAG: 4Fe-4S ferredoxin [Limnochordia bacterium]|jgi:hypothetical protein
MGCCPGSKMMEFSQRAGDERGQRLSHLRQWPVQLHLLSPEAPYFQGADVLLSADCVAYALADFHKDHLRGHSLAIACPKLDGGQESYLEKVIALIDGAKINTLTVMIMQVPCCMGLVALVQQALARAERQIPVQVKVVSLQGEILREEWL